MRIVPELSIPMLFPDAVILPLFMILPIVAVFLFTIVLSTAEIVPSFIRS